MRSTTRRALVAIATVTCAGLATAQALRPGETRGSAWQHTPSSLAAAISDGALVVPASATGNGLYAGRFRDAPAIRGPLAVVVFLHGSSGLGLTAIGEWQRWLASLGVASLAPDSFALPDRITYGSPVEKETYERIHALRASEISAALAALQKQPWVDARRILLAGTSEGSVAVARYAGTEFAGRIVYSWSCESNYFVTEPRNAFEADKPVLNVISSVDPYFSPANPYLGNPGAKGHCADALKDNRKSAIVLVPGAPHTLINLPQARDATAAFIAEVLGR
ncbi:MAG TPA: alpha/beta hydrolase [Caldimonas sp.]|nr:alpha/beta hydrolase [Caldimonas sp.]